MLEENEKTTMLDICIDKYIGQRRIRKKIKDNIKEQR
jgi:hypothetical protein